MASPIIKRAVIRVPKWRGNYKAYPIIPNKSVSTKAVLKLMCVNNSPDIKAPKAAPIAGKALIMINVYH